MLGVALALAGLPLAAALLGSGAAAAVLAALGWGRRWRDAGVVALLAVCPLAAAWTTIDQRARTQPELARYVPAGESVLARVTGVVEGTIRDVDYRRGAFARFAYQAPGTLAQLRVERIDVGEGPVPTRGRLLLRIDEHDHTLEPADRIVATGWLAALNGPANPGEFDFAAMMRDRGVVGRLSLTSRDNWRDLDAPWYAVGYWIERARSRVSRACLESLRHGLRDAGSARGLLETLLLGHWGEEMGNLRDPFRRVGLAHVLSISGAHLGILMGMVWLVARLAVPDPPRAALVVLAVLLMYVSALPMRTPIVRAAIMAGVFCVAYAAGRRPRPMALLAVAAVVVLLWRPADLVSPGFQLSFGVVAALLLWTRRVSEMLLPPPMIEPERVTAGQRAARAAADYAAVSVIAFGVALPLVAYHYQLVSPLAMLTSALALPVLTALLGLGYVKIAAGLVVGEAGGVLAGPLRWMSETMIALVVGAERWRWSSVELPEPPPWGWVVAALGAVVAAASGRLRGRRGWAAGAALAAALIASLGWTTRGGADRPPVAAAAPPAAEEAVRTDRPVARLSMLAVGDGSCFVLELPGHVLMFDCGTQNYLDVGTQSVAPALAKWGIGRIDTLVISHADLDHYAGVLDVVDRVPTGRVLTTPQVLAEAAAERSTSTSFLVSQLRERGLMPRPVSRGWREHHGRATLTALWPPADLDMPRNNDQSLVLAVDLSLSGEDRRLLLNGDVQSLAKPALLAAHRASGLSLSADVTDLPHHGSFVEESPAWLEAVAPRVVLQSTGRARLRDDPWPELLRRLGVTRYTTPEHGCTTITVQADGGLAVETFR